MADEVTNVSNWEQLGVLVRYLKDSEASFLCVKITGAALCDEIIAGLKELGLDPSNCRSQRIDGVGNMAGVQNGCAVNCTQSALRSLCEP